MTVEKSSIEKYSIRLKHGWAIITVDVAIGMVQIHSDYGDWGYHWSAPGKDFKDFLIDTSSDPEYIMGKFASHRNWLDLPKTLEACRKRLIECRRRGLSKEDARAGWEVIDGCSGAANIEEFYDSAISRPAENGHKSLGYYLGCDGSELPIVTDFEPSIRMFMERLWPVFIQALREEKAVPA